MYALGFVEIGLSCGSLLFLECSRLSSNIMKNFLLLNFSVSDYHDFEIRAKHFCLSLGNLQMARLKGISNVGSFLLSGTFTH